MASGLQPRALAAAVGQMAVRRVGALGDRLRRAVERDRHDHDRDAREQRERRVRVEPVRHDVAEALAADQPGDDHQRQGEHDRLVDRQQELPAGERELHLRERLPARRAERLAASTVSCVTLRMPSAVIRTAGGTA